MSSITFQCKSCDADFELDVARLIEKPSVLKCTNCGAKPPANRAGNFGLALEELMAAVAPLRTKFRFEMAIESEELDEAEDEAGVDGTLTFPSALVSDEDDDDDDFEDDEDEEDEEDAEADDDDFDAFEDEEEEAEADNF